MSSDRADREALAGLDEIYTNEVMYFGKKSNKDEVIKDKWAFCLFPLS